MNQSRRGCLSFSSNFVLLLYALHEKDLPPRHQTPGDIYRRRATPGSGRGFERSRPSASLRQTSRFAQPMRPARELWFQGVDGRDPLRGPQDDRPRSLRRSHTSRVVPPPAQPTADTLPSDTCRRLKADCDDESNRSRFSGGAGEPATIYIRIECLPHNSPWPRRVAPPSTQTKSNSRRRSPSPSVHPHPRRRTIASSPLFRPRNQDDDYGAGIFLNKPLQKYDLPLFSIRALDAARFYAATFPTAQTR